MKISYSTSIPARARCKHCGSKPYVGFHLPDRLSLLDPLRIKILKDYIWKITQLNLNGYLNTHPRNYKNINSFSRKINYSKVGIRFHQYFGLSDKMTMNQVAYLCKCHRMCWTIPINERAHVLNRKSRKTYPDDIKVY